ncbi:MAG: ABC transporter ATP-binding protein [Candidatus Lariskella arthropodorum]|uniref:ABC transporter ATP-binding protein n=1 Tax=Candidatus Lariskella endosymbiont of Epinotia ramella TaxID=3066224 RepID=UPI0030D528F4
MLHIKNVYKSFPGVFKTALDDLSFSLNKGEFCVCIGSNGSGKSTLIKTIVGEHKIDKGSIVIDEEDFTNLSLQQRSKSITYVTQNITNGTFQEMTLLENLALARMRVTSPKLKHYMYNIDRIKEEVISLNLGLDKFFNSKVGNLSGGQQQMIAVVMATLFHTKLLLLDEHCCALDPKMQRQLMYYTAACIVKNDITSLMVTHNMQDAIMYGDRIIMLSEGRIVLDINKEKKSKMKLEELLQLFHQHEDIEHFN